MLGCFGSLSGGLGPCPLLLPLPLFPELLDSLFTLLVAGPGGRLGVDVGGRVVGSCLAGAVL